MQLHSSWCLSSVVFLLSIYPLTASADPGVTDTEVFIGEPAVFTGPSAGLGVETWRGMQAAFDEANANGGVHGRRLEAVLCDDRYEPDGADRCVVNLIKTKKVFILANSVGTPTIARTVRFLQAWAADRVFLFGNYTGAQLQRNMPYAPYVFNIRASYQQETETHVVGCMSAGLSRIGTYVQNDAYGKDGEDGVRKAVAKHGARLLATTAYERGTKFDADVSTQVEALRSAGVNCVSTTGSYQGVAAFIRTSRAKGWNVPIYAVSFTGVDQLLSFLKDGGSGLTDNVIITEVVPHPNDTALKIVQDYRAAIDRYNPELPPAPFDKGGYTATLKYTYGSLEGYINTRLLIDALARAGRDLSRSSFKTAAEGIKGFDIGLGSKNLITWAPVTGPADVANHQALNSIWYAVFRDGRTVQISASDLRNFK